MSSPNSSSNRYPRVVTTNDNHDHYDHHRHRGNPLSHSSSLYNRNSNSKINTGTNYGYYEWITNSNYVIFFILFVIFAYSTFITLFPQQQPNDGNNGNLLYKVKHKLYTLFTITIPHFAMHNVNQAWDEIHDDDDGERDRDNDNHDDDANKNAHDYDYKYSNCNNDNSNDKNENHPSDNSNTSNKNLLQEQQQHDLNFHTQSRFQYFLFQISIAYEWILYMGYYIIDFVLDWSAFIVGGVFVIHQDPNTTTNSSNRPISSGADGDTTSSGSNNNNFGANNYRATYNGGRFGIRRRREGFLINKNSMPILEEVPTTHTVSENIDVAVTTNTSTSATDASKPLVVEYNGNIEPAFLNEEDYPAGWLVYDPISGEVVKKRSLVR